MIGNSKIVHFLTASDRINYGDLLFPLIFKKYCIGKDVDFFNYGIVKSDLKYFGALKTLSYKKFQKNAKKNGGNVIIGGGEVLFAEWRTLYSFINPFFAKLCKVKLFNKIELKFKLSKWILSNGKVLVPFAPSSSELENSGLQIFYNAVGGSFHGDITSESNILKKKRLDSSDYISVRDIRSFDSLASFGIKASLVPDSALIISDYFSIQELINKVTFNISTLESRYVFVQLGINKKPRDISKFAKELSLQLNSLKSKAILCPIGMAPNHEDHIVLRELEKLSPDFKLIIPKNIYDIMYLIAKSMAYTGTSLHGLITAQSFNVPFIPLNKEVKKMDYYCKTWTRPICNGCLDFSNIKDLSSILSEWDYKLIEMKTIEQKVKVYNNFKLIFDKLLI